jgi:hypothetical protein
MPGAKYNRLTHNIKWMLLTTIFLAIANTAGDNVAVVPALAVILRQDIFPIIWVSYFGVGACLAGISAWIGAVTRDESSVGWNIEKHSRHWITWAVLCVCLPASALTGGIFSGALIAGVLHIPQTYGALLGLTVYTIFVLCRDKRQIIWTNIVSFICVPVLLYSCLGDSHTTATVYQASILQQDDKWAVIWALVGYNAGGLRPLLLAETGNYLGCRWTSVIVAVAAKWLEGLVTMVFAYAVVKTGVTGMLPLGQILEIEWGWLGRYFFTIGFIGLCFSCMVPAMAVNAYCIKELTGGGYICALFEALIIVFFGTLLGTQKLLWVLSFTGMGAALVIITVFWYELRRDCGH